MSEGPGIMERLDEQQIRGGLPVTVSEALGSFTLLREVDSTNRFLLEFDGIGASGVHVCMAETQSAGRGRRGRPWISPMGTNLYLSILRVHARPSNVQGLSLVAGIAVARALQSLGVRGIALKWPNDIQIGGEKLGGVLIEMSGTATGPWRVVTGIGINVAMPADIGDAIDQPWTDLASHGAPASRNQLAARVLSEVIMAEAQFGAAGFEAFRRDWDGLDVLRNRRVAVQEASRTRQGTARGVDADGALMVEIDGQRERIVSADISLRALG